MRNRTSKKLKVIDLFCGCGGLSLGFKRGGFNIVLGVDFNQTALETYSNNIRTETYDIDLFDHDNVNRIIKIGKSVGIEVVIGGPPCQGFSLTGPRNFDDKRNSLYLAFLETVRKLKPKGFLLENVTGLETLWNGQIKKEIINRFDQIGYNVTTQILNSANYGVPQIRKRIFLVGVKRELGSFVFPDPTHSPLTYITCEEAIGDLPGRELDIGDEIGLYNGSPFTIYQKNMRDKSKVLFNHVATDHKKFVREVISLVPEGGNYKDLPPGIGESRKFNEAWTRYHSKKPSRTIDTGHRNHFHYKWNRVPTIRENARLQSFPDSFRFYGNKTQQNRQVGDAVPPILAKQIALKLKKLLKNNDH